MKGSELLYMDEIDELVELGVQMHKECEPDIPFSELEIRANIWACLGDVSRSQLNCWIVRQGDKMIGFGVGTISKFMYSQALCASLMLWYVLPEYRKTRAAFEILHHFQNWSNLSGAIRQHVGVSKMSVGEADLLNKMFVKRGYKRYGELFYQDRKG